MHSNRLWIFALSAAITGAALTGCGGNSASTEGGTATTDTKGGEGSTQLASLTGTITGDGSSTVGPITEAVAEEFGKEAQNVKAAIGTSGTGGGFKKFIAGETAIQNASRPIKKEEDAKMKEGKREYIELPIAYDGIALVVHPTNTWASDLTVDELKKMWEPNSKVTSWDKVRAGFPAKPIKLYGAGSDSGTFDYFTDAIVGEEGKSRKDYTASENDNSLVQGVSRDPNALAYFGHAYYEQNKGKLKLVKVNGVESTVEAIADGSYKPLSRPLFIYVDRKAADKPEVAAFIDFYLDQPDELISEVGYVPLPKATREAVKARWKARKVGTMYTTDASKKQTLDQLLKA